MTRRQIEAKAKKEIPGFRVASERLNGARAYRVKGSPALLALDDVMRRLGYA